ncbi:hypothetical protein [Duganella sp. P38]|uniref:hypothetical protein n=1 Tax=Duganella sp. P38 TaxID=3423949 RepID=UPI003D7AE5D4
MLIWSGIIDLHSPGWRRRGWLVVIASAHVLGFLFWKAPALPVMDAVRPHAAITYILTPFKPAPPIAAPPPALTRPSAPPSRMRPAPVPAPASASVAPTPQAITMPAVPAAAPSSEPAATAETAPTLPSDPFAAAKPQDDLRQRAIKSAAAADKAALKESFTQRDRKLVNDDTALGMAIAKAYRGGGTRQVEIVAADGSRITKFILPGGAEVCYRSASNNFSGGRDPFRDSGKIVASSCP